MYSGNIHFYRNLFQSYKYLDSIKIPKQIKHLFTCIFYDSWPPFFMEIWYYLSSRLQLPRDTGKIKSVFPDRNKLSNFPILHSLKQTQHTKPFCVHWWFVCFFCPSLSGLSVKQCSWNHSKLHSLWSRCSAPYIAESQLKDQPLIQNYVWCEMRSQLCIQ